eukprot:7385873-Prymnesium_polylepis.3
MRATWGWTCRRRCAKECELGPTRSSPGPDAVSRLCPRDARRLPRSPDFPFVAQASFEVH